MHCLASFCSWKDFFPYILSFSIASDHSTQLFSKRYNIASLRPFLTSGALLSTLVAYFGRRRQQKKRKLSVSLPEPFWATIMSEHVENRMQQDAASYRLLEILKIMPRRHAYELNCTSLILFTPGCRIFSQMTYKMQCRGSFWATNMMSM